VLVIDSLLQHQLYSPERIAFSESGKDIGYRDLFVRAEKIGTVLTHHGVRPGDRVALLLPRGIDAACAVYGTLFAGACYAPLDISNPESRLTYIVDDLQPRCIIGLGKRPQWCEALQAEWIDIHDPEFFDEAEPIDVNVIYRAGPEELAAILYTSGSTGNPKGVCISCRAIDAFVKWSAATFGLGAGDRIASLAPFHFDLSLFDLFTVVYCGAGSHFIPQTLTLAPGKLVNWLEENEITGWYTVPSILAFLAMRGGLNPERLPAMKRILFAGEVFPIAGLIRLAGALPHVELFNLFGPTETNVCTFWQVDRDRLDGMESIPIGQAACEAELTLADSGELLVSGPCVMSGYWSNGAMQERSSDSAFPTGDRVSCNELGEFLYHGRMDRMIKSSGYRIEPAEVEEIINRFDAVAGSVVIGEHDPISGQRLVAVVAGDALDMESLRIHLRNNLVSYMQPYRLVQVESLPRLSNGKIDLKAAEALI